MKTKTAGRNARRRCSFSQTTLKTSTACFALWSAFVSLAFITGAFAQTPMAPGPKAPKSVTIYSQDWNGQDLPREFTDFRNWTLRYLANSVGGLTPQTVPFAQIREGVRLALQRKLVLEEMIKSDPRQALSLTVPEFIRQQLPPEIVRHLETRVSGIGDYSVVAEVPAQGKSSQPVRRFVRLGKQTFQTYVYGRRVSQTTKIGIPLHGIEVYGVLALADSCMREFESDEPSPQRITSAQTHKTGTAASGGPLLVQAGERFYRFASRQQLIDAEAQLEAAESALGPYPIKTSDQILEGNAAIDQNDIRAASTGWTTGNKHVLVIRVDFSDLPGDPIGLNNTTPVSGSALYTVPYVQDVIDSTVAPFYQHSSYGLTSLTTTVTTQVYRMPQTAAYYATTGYDHQLHVDARSAASADYDLANYDRIIVLFSSLNAIPGNQITYGGAANVGGPNVWINGQFYFDVVAHELGHTYGVLHAKLWQVNDGDPISPQGFSWEYGDDFDIMGNNFVTNDQGADFNPYFKYLLGWIPDSQISSITASGIYRINRFDDALATGILALKIPKDAGKTYWIGCRRNFTNNASMQHGAYIIWAYDSPESALLDMTTPGNNVEDAALGIGATFTDGVLGVAFKPVGEGGSGPNQYLDVQVTFSPLPPFFSGLGPFNPSDARVTPPFVVNGTTVSQPAQTSDPNNGGDLEFRFNVPSIGDYEVSALLNCPDGSSNSLYINIDSQPTDPTMIWDVPITSGFEPRTAAWRGNGTSTSEFDPKIWHLFVGEHLFVIRGREANTVIGPITIVAVPTPTPPPTPTPTPSPVRVTYDYVGSHYTSTNAPTVPGFTLNDFMIASVRVNNADWGTTVSCDTDLHSGPWFGLSASGRITTDSNGNILNWSLDGSGPGLDLHSGGNSDGSGQDNIIYSGAASYHASVEYQAGSRDVANYWTLVPNPGVILSRNSNGDFIIHFAGPLQESPDLVTWAYPPNDPVGPLIIPKDEAPSKLFFRVPLQSQ